MARILVVEDNATNRLLTRELLFAHGHEVIDACDGRAGIDSVRTHRPDLVLLDLQLPDVDGFSVIREIRGDASIASTPILVVTAFAMGGDRERVLACGCDGYVSKPIRYKALLDEIEHALSGRRP